MTIRQFDSYHNDLLVGRKSRAKVAGIAILFKELFTAIYLPNTIACIPFEVSDREATLGNIVGISPWSAPRDEQAHERPTIKMNKF